MFTESAAESWELRYGAAPNFPLPQIDAYLNHRSVRSFTAETIPEETIRGLVAAAQSASTSSNLQVASLISVQDPDRRAQVNALCGDQKQIAAASWFFVFCADHYRIRQAAETHGVDPNGLPYEEMLIVAAIDAALMAERMVCAAEALGIGSCYIGAARNHPRELAELLGMPHGVIGLFGLCLGYPSRAGSVKPRLSQEAVWFRESYDPAARFREYDARMAAFYEAQQMKGPGLWSLKSAERCKEGHMSGREALGAILRERGFGLK